VGIFQCTDYDYTKTLLENQVFSFIFWAFFSFFGILLGRVASKAAHILRGKHKATYTPNIDCGDFIIIINAEKAILTGNKLDNKKYYNHSGYPGGLRERTAREMQEKYPIEMVERKLSFLLPLFNLHYFWFLS